MELAIAMKTAVKDSVELQNKGGPEVHKMTTKPGAMPSRSSGAQCDGNYRASCFRCGRKHHPDTCYFWHEECYNCHLTGHAERRRRKPGKKMNTNVLTASRSNSNSDQEDSLVVNI